MKRIIFRTFCALGLLALVPVSTLARADVRINLDLFGPAPYYVEPPPVYYEPPARYYREAPPVYYGPRTVYREREWDRGDRGDGEGHDRGRHRGQRHDHNDGEHGR